MLPLSIPAHALLHPTNPDRVYFFLRSCIFAVDLRLRKLMEFNECEMRAPPRELLLKRSSRFVHARQYDPSSNRMYRCLVYSLFYLGVNLFELF